LLQIIENFLFIRNWLFTWVIVPKDKQSIKKEINLSFENLLKLAMNYLDNDSSNVVTRVVEGSVLVRAGVTTQ